MAGHKFLPSNVLQKGNSQSTMNNSTLFLNGLKKATVLFLSAIIGMAGNASFIIVIIVLSFFLHYWVFLLSFQKRNILCKKISNCQSF